MSQAITYTFYFTHTYYIFDANLTIFSFGPTLHENRAYQAINRFGKYQSAKILVDIWKSDEIMKLDIFKFFFSAVVSSVEVR